MKLVFSFLVLFSSLAFGFEDGGCLALGEGVPRPLPYAVDKDSDDLPFLAVTGSWVAVVYVPQKELAEPSHVRVQLFHHGRRKEERILWLRGLLPSPRTVEDQSGKKVTIGVQQVSVGPGGELVALVSGSRILVFRAEAFLGSVDASPPADPVLTRDRLFWTPWAAEKGDVVLWQWGLDPSLPPQPVLHHEREGEPGKKWVAVREDGGLWVVDGFTGETTLLTATGAKKRQFAAPIRLPVEPDEQKAQRALELEKSLAAELGDATRRPPQVELRPAPREPWVAWVGTMGKDLLVKPAGEAKLLYWLADGAQGWQCLQIDSGRPVSAIRSFPDGFWLVHAEGSRFFSVEDLRGLQQKRQASSYRGR